MPHGVETAVVVRRRLNGWADPVDVLEKFLHRPLPVLLHSSGDASDPPGHARWSLLSADPFDRIAWRVGEPADPFDRLQEAVGRYPCGGDPVVPFIGGAMGYIGYDAGRVIEGIRARPGAAPEPLFLELMPDVLFGLYAWSVLWDHARHAMWAVSTGLPETGRSRRCKARADVGMLAATVQRVRLRRHHRRGPAGAVPPAAAVVSSNVSRARYLEAVRRAKDLIGCGSVYQVNLSQRLEMPAPSGSYELLRAMQRYSPAPFSAYMDAEAVQIVSASPERFLRLRGRVAQCRPIKGTRPRGRSMEHDDELRRELATSSKDRAENVMIVDLVRNDLGRVCRPGSVRTVALCRLESFASVHHLVSVVEGDLAAGRGIADLLKAVFPGGSMTGAPKVRAMQAIENLETDRRGLYAGAMGYVSFCGGMDLSIVIRTAIVCAGRIWLQVGGGIVSDSDPELEYRESLDKALSVRRAVSATVSGNAVRCGRDTRRGNHRWAR